MGTGTDEPGLVGVARDNIRERYQKPGNVFLGIVSRLDAWVTGAIVFGRTSKAAARLSEQFRNRTIEKTYWAVVQAENSGHSGGRDLPPAATLRHWIGKDENRKRMQATELDAPRPRHLTQLQEAHLEYRVLGGAGPVRLVEIRLITGRKHQIRAQFAATGWPVVGDRKYGSSESFAAGIALHSRQLALLHPTGRNRLDFRAKLPEYWPDFAKKMD